MIQQAGLGDRLHVYAVGAGGERESAQVHGVNAGQHFSQFGDVLAIAGDVDGVVIDRAFLAAVIVQPSVLPLSAAEMVTQLSIPLSTSVPSS